MKFLVFITLVCLAAAVPLAEDNEASAEVDSKFTAGGRNEQGGAARAGYRGDSSKTSHGKKNSFGEAASEREQDYNKKSKTLIVKTEENSGRISESGQKRGAASANAGAHSKNKSAGGIYGKGGQASNRGAGYEKEGRAWDGDTQDGLDRDGSK